LHIAASVDTGLMDECSRHSRPACGCPHSCRPAGRILRLLSARTTASGIADLVWIELEALQLAVLVTMENPEEFAEIVHQFQLLTVGTVIFFAIFLMMKVILL